MHKPIGYLALVILLSASTTFGGLIPSEVDISKKLPECLTVFAGGVVGPGTGVTIANNCTQPVTIATLEHGTLPFDLSRAEGVDAYMTDGSSLSRNVTLDSSGVPCSYDSLPPKTAPKPAKACGIVGTPPCKVDHSNPFNLPVCSTIHLAPKATILMFTKPYFRAKGPEELLVSGKVYQPR